MRASDCLEEGAIVYVLGLHLGHDSGAALVKDGQVIATVNEERFTRLKHYSGVPWASCGYCLRQAGIEARDVDMVAVVGKVEPYIMRYLYDSHVLEKIARENSLRARKNRIPKSLKNLLRRLVRTLPGMGSVSIPDPVIPPTYYKPYDVGDKEVVLIDHHLAHAASAYHTCGFQEKTLVVTADGVGDDSSLTVWRGEGGKMEPLLEVGQEGSLGWFYGVVTEALGWWVGDGEGKTMGLAPYGDPDAAEGCLDPILPRYAGGQLVKAHDFGTPVGWEEKGCWHWHFPDTEYVEEQIARYGRENVAAEAQRLLEREMLEVILPWLEREQTGYLACSGGVFLNVKMNQRIWESGKVKGQHIYPNAGDGGLPAGAALHVYYQYSGDSTIRAMRGVYDGPEFSNEEIEKLLQMRKLPYKRCEDITNECAELLAQGYIVAWMQGRMESGPRALGNRSILMDPRKAENKDIINARVKFREPFRPFCPSLLAEAADDYFVNGRLEPYMITSFEAKEEKKKEIPAVVHVDGTCRPQTVTREVNEKYWRLIQRFGELTSVPVILNTSLNIRGEPIVCTPQDTIRCFYDTGIDYLALGDFILSKT
jgi:carbamoyltransferase